MRIDLHRGYGFDLLAWVAFCAAVDAMYRSNNKRKDSKGKLAVSFVGVF